MRHADQLASQRAERRAHSQRGCNEIGRKGDEKQAEGAHMDAVQGKEKQLQSRVAVTVCRSGRGHAE